MTRSPVRVVLVEDSITQRAHLARALQVEGDITVVAEAATAGGAVEAVARHRPDIVTMDLDLPGGGQEAITRIMAETPTPILVVSAVAGGTAAAETMAALAAGAVDATPKPPRWTPEAERDLRRQVRMVATVPVVRRRGRNGVERHAPRRGRALTAVVGIAASTGGPPALCDLLRALPSLPVPILLVQHIHPSFMAGFVTWLDSAVPVRVEQAVEGALPVPGRVHVAPGEVHLRLAPDGRMTLDAEPQSVHRPSADELFHSIARSAGAHAVGVIMTGMGDDGARGLLAMRRAGARTFGQDEETSTVFGMPAAAERLGAVQKLLSPPRLATAIAAAARELV